MNVNARIVRWSLSIAGAALWSAGVARGWDPALARIADVAPAAAATCTLTAVMIWLDCRGEDKGKQALARELIEVYRERRAAMTRSVPRRPARRHAAR